MTALTTLAACVVAPWLGCRAVRAWFGVGRSASAAQGERALERSQRVSLLGGTVVVPAAAVAGALFVDPMVGTRWPTAGSWLFATICATTAWSSLALARRSADEADSMPALEVIGRVVQMVTVPAVGVALSLLAVTVVDRTVPAVGPVRAVLAALLSFGALVVVSPWLAMQLGLWRLLPFRIQSGGVSWRVAHLPVPSPFLTHAAALPWLRTVLVTDGLFQRAPALHWRSLVRYEIGGSPQSQSERVARWLLALTLSAVLFVAASAVGADDPRKLVAATVLAVVFTGASSWFANRQPASTVTLDPEGPSVQELAQTLRSLPSPQGQALPRTSHRPVGVELYDRLYALGHDPGRRPSA